MAHGAPDDSNVVKLGPIYRVDDLAELAVRLGSPSLWDRRGEIVVIDSFEHGLGRSGSLLSGTGAHIRLSCARALHAGYCVALKAGADASRYAGLAYIYGLPQTTKLGLEFSFTIDDDTEYWEWRIFWYTGSSYSLAAVRYDAQDDTLYYLDSDGDWTEFASSVTLRKYAEAWQIGKLVADYTDLEYVRFVLSNTVYSLADLSLQTVVSSTSPQLVCQALHYGTSGNNPVAYLDAVMVTQNEP